MVRATHQAEPLIAAIEAYHQKKGSYPNQLQDLVPEFIQAIPSTSMVGYPEFKYSTAKSDRLFKTYQLKISTRTIGINFDSFVYWPEADYPARMYGGGVERINDWAYVHE